ncbi:uncharacterized protein [Dermacentor albipictus]|uniref:uncharacterized protein n=1 Tax=Dermacentor albipictus TaxID=60249 RepID=UPI0031FC4F0E
MLPFRWHSRSRSASLSSLRSPSPTSLSEYHSPAVRLVRLRSRAATKFRWKQIYASLVVISCFIMAILVISAWNRRMAAHPKDSQPQRQEGPFGRFETVAPAAETSDADYWLPLARAVGEKPGGEAAPDAELKGQTTMYEALVPVVQQDEENSPTGSYDSPLVIGANGTMECDTPQCGKIKQWFEEAVVSQADPCRERNTFVCNASLMLPSWDATAGKKTLDELMMPASSFATTSGQGATNEYHSAKEKNGLSYISEACLRYAWNPEEGVEDVLAFLSHFKLDLRNIAEDTTEDPLGRMIELSFEYGLEVLVSFSLDYNVTSDIYNAFVVQINVSSELEEFFWSLGSLNEEAVDDFYQLLLRRYALVEDSEIVQHLQQADVDIYDILNVTTESGTQAKKSIGELARATGVTTDRWTVLLASCCPNQSKCNEYVVTNERSLALVAYVARAGQALRMRRLLAWHVLRCLVAAKADVLAALNHTGLTNPESKCYWLLEKLGDIRYTAIDLFEGIDAVSTRTIASVASFMVQFQNAVASVFNSPQRNKNGGATKIVTKQREVVIPGGDARQLLDAQRGHTFTAFTVIKKRHQKIIIRKQHNGSAKERQLSLKGSSFPFLWLRRLRAWHALPPLLQALLPVMATLADIKRLNAFFRLPYYDARILAAYNFAALGHVVGRAIAHKVDHLRRQDKSMDERWQRFWESSDVIDSNNVYCAEATINENDTWRQKRVNEFVANDALLDHVVGLKMAHLALVSSTNRASLSYSERQLLPGIHLSSKQLFLILHCALGCTMDASRDSHHSIHKNNCMVVYRSFRPFIDKPCAQPTDENALNDCRYI